MSPLWKLCSLGEVERVRAALGREENVNQTGGSENLSPLMHAAGQSSDDHVSILRLLLEQPSTDLNLADVNGSTALHLATFCGNIEAVRLLLADPRRYEHSVVW